MLLLLYSLRYFVNYLYLLSLYNFFRFYQVQLLTFFDQSSFDTLGEQVRCVICFVVILRLTQIKADTTSRQADIMRSNLGCGVPSYTSSSPTSFDPSSEIMRTMMVISGSLNLRCDIAYENIFSFTKNIERFVRILIVVNQRVEVYLLQTLGIQEYTQTKDKQAIKAPIFQKQLTLQQQNVHLMDLFLKNLAVILSKSLIITLSKQQQMSLDKRYDAFLSDLLTLFEEITVRYITQKPIDIQKFKHYFNMFYDRMQQLQTSFHESKLKITTLLNRLRQSCSNSGSQSLDKMETIKRSINKKQTSEQCAQSFIRSVSSKKKTDFSKQLGSIVEEDEHFVNRIYNKRSQTVSGYRSHSHNDNRSQIRPKTGYTDSKRYALDKQTINRTISIKVQQTQKSEQQQKNYEVYTLDAEQILKNKRKFYEQLQKNKQIQISVLGKEQVKWIFGRKKSKSGWSKRINQLF